ncbi:MAG: hypothetical protein FWG12_05060 [Holophagaceae bacterium]|nr:hypothetical protein [Holophagaceae bacterium]
MPTDPINTVGPIKPSLLEILCCPALHDGSACHGHLIDLGDGLQCAACGLVYPIENGIPVLLADHAKSSHESPKTTKTDTDNRDDCKR